MTQIPKVAVLATCIFPRSHGEMLVSRLLSGYHWPPGTDGAVLPARLQVASLYLDQLTGDWQQERGPEIGRQLASEHDVPVFSSVAEAIGLGRQGVAVDGVVIIGEHGDYPLNEYGQKLYPRRRLFDAVVASMQAGGRIVPLFTDKHLATDWPDAAAMYQDATRLGIPILAGSVLPLTWRIPTGTRWPANQPMRQAVATFYGDRDAYGFHALEALQAIIEHRPGGESGVAAVHVLPDDAARAAVQGGAVPVELWQACLSAAGAPTQAPDVTDVFSVEHRDGLMTWAVRCPSLPVFAVAARGPEHQVACEFHLQDEPYDHFTFQVRQIEQLVRAGAAPYPIERTLLTTGTLAALFRAQDSAEPVDTPHLAISYVPVDPADTGVDRPAPLCRPTHLE